VPDATAAATATSDAEEATLQLFQWPHEHPFCWYKLLLKDETQKGKYKPFLQKVLAGICWSFSLV
jgi:hypothetical protein